MFCQYKNIFGLPGIGFHNHFMFNFAILDLIATFIIAIIIAAYFDISVIKSFIILMVSAIIIHKLFCVNTVLNKLLFG